MRFRFELQIALARVLAVVVLQRALDVDRVGVVPLNQIGVVAVHRANQIGQGCDERAWKAAPKPRRFLREIEREIC